MKRESSGSATGKQSLGAMVGQPCPKMVSASGQTSTCLLQADVGSSRPASPPASPVAAAACETAMWEEWTQATYTGDEVSTSCSPFLPDLPASRHSFPFPFSFPSSDLLAPWMSSSSSFHSLSSVPSSLSPDNLDPLACTSVVDLVAADLLDSANLSAFPQASAKAPSLYHPRERRVSGALEPLSLSSPLALQNGLLNPLGDPWDSVPCLQWSTVTSTRPTDRGEGNNGNGTIRILSPSPSFLPDNSTSVAATENHLANSRLTKDSSALSRPLHTDIFIGPNGTFESTPGGWTPQLMYDDSMSETTMTGGRHRSLGPTPFKVIASWREPGEATSRDWGADSQQNRQSEIYLLRDRMRTVITVEPATQGGSSVTMSSRRAGGKRSGAESTRTRTTTQSAVDWPGKHRLELVEVVDDGDEDMTCGSPPVLKRPKMTPVEQAKALQRRDQTLRGAELRSHYCPRSSSLAAAAAAEAMGIMAIGPALNTNGKPRARRGSATDPQSVYARHRREKINERLKNLQKLVPTGAKVDIVTMLDEAIHYVKFLQNQFELLKSDDCWMYASPNNYNGIDLSILCSHSRELESNASKQYMINGLCVGLASTTCPVLIASADPPTNPPCILAACARDPIDEIWLKASKLKLCRSLIPLTEEFTLTRLIYIKESKTVCLRQDVLSSGCDTLYGSNKMREAKQLHIVLE